MSDGRLIVALLALLASWPLQAVSEMIVKTVITRLKGLAKFIESIFYSLEKSR